jgi:Caudovirus prohead protease.
VFTFGKNLKIAPMAKTFVLHDETVNTKGFRMLTSGCNLEELIKNPVMLYMHNDWSRPIGRWENIRIEGSQILADAVFDMEDKRENGGAEISSQVERDFIRMASIGAWPPEEVSYDEVLMLPGQLLATVTKWTAREASIVSIGSNHNTMVFYDRGTGKQIELNDPSAVIKLMDSSPIIINPKINMMDELNQILNLADTATPVEKANAVKAIIAERDTLKQEKEAAEIKLADFKQKEKDDFIALVDAAVLDGRIDAAGKEPIITLYDVSAEKAKAALNAIPKRQTVQSQVQSTDKDAIELADLTSKTWDQIDSEGKQGLLKSKYPDLYEQKFEEKFKKKPKKQ